jgi:CheY-like chemotaxis protein
MSVLLSIGPEPELLLLRTHILENAGYSVVTLSNTDYALAVFNSADFEGVIFCHALKPGLRNDIVREMMRRRPVPVFVFERPIAPGADIALRSVGPKTIDTDNLCHQLLRIFRLSTGSKRHSLQSWKEVAAYVGRGVRTVQRWEELGMPVHRPGNGARATVFALVAEVDEWMKLQ